MPEDYFDEGGGGAPAAAEPQSQPAEDQDQKGGEDQTALLPKSFFSEEDLKPGYKCQVEITGIHDNEVEVKYLGSPEHEEEAPPGENQPPPVPDGMGGGLD
jgi:hypothetical protein